MQIQINNGIILLVSESGYMAMAWVNVAAQKPSFPFIFPEMKFKLRKKEEEKRIEIVWAENKKEKTLEKMNSLEKKKKVDEWDGCVAPGQDLRTI